MSSLVSVVGTIVNPVQPSNEGLYRFSVENEEGRFYIQTPWLPQLQRLELADLFSLGLSPHENRSVPMFTVPIEERYFEDYLTGSVHEFGSIVVEEAEVIAFAQRFDPQPFHPISLATTLSNPA